MTTPRSSADALIIELTSRCADVLVEIGVHGFHWNEGMNCLRGSLIYALETAGMVAGEDSGKYRHVDWSATSESRKIVERRIAFTPDDLDHAVTSIADVLRIRGSFDFPEGSLIRLYLRRQVVYVLEFWSVGLPEGEEALESFFRHMAALPRNQRVGLARILKLHGPVPEEFHGL